MKKLLILAAVALSACSLSAQITTQKFTTSMAELYNMDEFDSENEMSIDWEMVLNHKTKTGFINENDMLIIVRSFTYVTPDTISMEVIDQDNETAVMLVNLQEPVTLSIISVTRKQTIKFK